MFTGVLQMTRLKGYMCQSLEEIWMKMGLLRKIIKKCHVATFLYYFTFEGAKGYFTFIKATLNIYFILKSIYEDEV